MSDVDATNRYHAYMAGWRRGAAGRHMQPELAEHRDAALREAHRDGYEQGRAAASAAHVYAKLKHGFEPSVLRSTDPEDDCELFDGRGYDGRGGCLSDGHYRCVECSSLSARAERFETRDGRRDRLLLYWRRQR